MEAGGHHDREREPSPSPEAAPEQPVKGWAERIRVIGGLVAVGIGVFAVTLITIVALIQGGDTAATIASASTGVIASIVGAYFGVKVGTDQTKTAAEGERRQAAKTAVFAAHLPREEADQVLALAAAAARGEEPPQPPPGRAT